MSTSICICFFIACSCLVVDKMTSYARKYISKRKERKKEDTMNQNKKKQTSSKLSLFSIVQNNQVYIQSHSEINVPLPLYYQRFFFSSSSSSSSSSSLLLVLSSCHRQRHRPSSTTSSSCSSSFCLLLRIAYLTNDGNNTEER